LRASLRFLGVAFSIYLGVGSHNDAFAQKFAQPGIISPERCATLFNASNQALKLPPEEKN